MRLVGNALLIISFLLTLGQIFILGPNLPDPIASHFDSNGVADGWTSRTGFLVLYGGLQLLGGLMLIAAAKLVWVLPTSLLNIPHKDYWLHEERRDETLRFSSHLLILIAGWTALFLVGVFQLTFQANLANNNVLPFGALPALITTYLILLVGVILVLMRKFHRPPHEYTSKPITR